MSLLTTGSVLAAFLAGMVALFAPCCIVFLAPSYLAAAVKNRRWRLLPLTFVFAAGLAVIMVPITLGISLIAGTIAKYHAPLYYAGGALMLLLAVYSLSGRMWSLPSFLRAPDTGRGDSASFFALGVFSGIASSCCAPVLAGVMTLSALSGSPVGGVMLGLAFVLGMTLPLFIMALVWDRLHLRDRSWLKARPIRLRLAGHTVMTNSVNVVVAAAFAIMGGFVIYLAGAAQMTTGPGFQVAIGRWLSRQFEQVQQWLSPVPEPVLGLLVAAIAALFVYATLIERRRDHQPATDRDNTQEPTLAHADASCHHSPSPVSTVVPRPGHTEETES
jgi:cytochrome c biogenesis protein CcdA